MTLLILDNISISNLMTCPKSQSKLQRDSGLKSPEVFIESVFPLKYIVLRTCVALDSLHTVSQTLAARPLPCGKQNMPSYPC